MTENKSLDETWWQRFLALFRRRHSALNSVEVVDGNSVSIQDPLLLSDELQMLVTELRNRFETSDIKQWDLNALAASTYLYHIDRILVKVRENILTIRYRSSQLADEAELLGSNEFIQVKEAERHCYSAILNLTTLLRNASIRDIYDDDVVNRIHTLELESANFNTAIRALNQLIFRHESIQQLAALEQTLTHTLVQPPPGFVYTHQGVTYSTTELLRKQLQEIDSVVDAEWLEDFIEVHDMLKKCYVVARKNIIKDLVDKMGDHIQNLITASKQKELDNELATKELTAIFNSIESIRFNSHRESRCSKNLFDKAKLARQQLRKACQHHPIAREYVQRYTIKRLSLNAKMKSSL